MGRRRRANTEATIAARLKEGRGQGAGTNYRPWLTVYDVPSRGTSERIHGHTTNRVHHLLSRLEVATFFYWDWGLTVVDVREQFPLLPLEDTRALARRLHMRHPMARGQDIVMTTDFLVTFQQGKETVDVAIDVKYNHDVNTAGPKGDRTRAKLDLERDYWLERGVQWQLVTDLEIDPTVVRNLRWLHPYRPFAALAPLTEEAVCRIHESLDQSRRDAPVWVAAEAVDRKLRLEPGTSMQVARHLWATRQWSDDLRVPLMPH